jgi:hypothetical protein
MTAMLKGKGPKMADVTAVTSSIVQGIAKAKPVVYAPVKWAVIMMVIMHLPRFMFNKMDI